MYSGLWKWSGRQDSNLRSPAPKAGALATTLRPVNLPESTGADQPHGDRPRVAYDPAGPAGAQVRTWLLQLGAQPVDRAEPGASGLPVAPQGDGIARADVAGFVRGLKGGGRSRGERFDDHGSVQSWPRGSF